MKLLKSIQETIVKTKRKVNYEMKLIVCPYCTDVVRLKKDKLKMCECGKCSGKYEKDGLTATISEHAIPIGFSNNSFIDALKSKPSPTFGTRFEAFVISKDATTIKVQKEGKK